MRLPRARLAILTFGVLFPLLALAGNPASPILPADNVQDPGSPSTVWGGCGPTDPNCYVTSSSGIATSTGSLTVGALTATSSAQIKTLTASSTNSTSIIWTNATGTNATITNLYISGTIAGTLTGSASTTNGTTTNAVVVNLLSASTTNTATTTTAGLFASFLNAVTGYFQNLFASVASIGQATVGTLTATGTVQVGSLTGIITGSAGTLSATTTSAGVASVVADETGSGALVFGTAPTVFGLTANGTTTAAGLAVSGYSKFTNTIDLNSNRIVNVATPVSNTDVATKSYVDAFVQGLSWQNAVKSLATTTIAASSTGDRYIIYTAGGVSSTGCAVKDIAENTGLGTWSCFSPATGTTVFVDSFLNIPFTYNGASWADLGSSVSHNSTTGVALFVLDVGFHDSAQFRSGSRRIFPAISAFVARTNMKTEQRHRRRGRGRCARLSPWPE